MLYWGRDGNSAHHKDRRIPELAHALALIKRMMYVAAVANSCFFSCFHINSPFSKCRQMSTVIVQIDSHF